MRMLRAIAAMFAALYALALLGICASLLALRADEATIRPAGKLYTERLLP